MQKSIAFFDFDGTITRKDTMLELVKYSRGRIGYLVGMGILSPWLIAMKIGLISKKKAKEKFLSYFFKNKSIAEFNADCFAFAKDYLPGLLRDDAISAIRKHKNEGTEVVVVTASAENWVAPWCSQNGLQFICTRLETTNQRLTGKILGENCNGQEKVSRIKERFDTAAFKNIFCYGDSGGDKQMLEIATHPSYRLFTK